MVIAGKDAGVTGKVLAASPSKGKVVVDKVAMIKRHTKPSKNDPQGGIKEKESFIDASNVMMYCPKCKKACAFPMWRARTAKESALALNAAQNLISSGERRILTWLTD